MTRYDRYEVDNRAADEMYRYYEARIEALQRRIAELEEMNKMMIPELIFGETPQSVECAL